MHLSPEDIAAAEACGVSFLPASDAQVQRLAMQRKIFYRAGEPVLATRGDGFFETAGTLQRLIEEGRRQQHDRTQWLEAAETPMAVPAESTVKPGPVPEPAVESHDASMTAPAPEAGEVSPKRRRQRRRRTGAAEAWVGIAPGEEPGQQDAPTQEPVAATPLPAGQPRSPARSVPRAAGTATAQKRGRRWLVAGAARRGRAAKHWSTRQR